MWVQFGPLWVHIWTDQKPQSILIVKNVSTECSEYKNHHIVAIMAQGGEISLEMQNLEIQNIQKMSFFWDFFSKNRLVYHISHIILNLWVAMKVININIFTAPLAHESPEARRLEIDVFVHRQVCIKKMLVFRLETS